MTRATHDLMNERFADKLHFEPKDREQAMRELVGTTNALARVGETEDVVRVKLLRVAALALGIVENFIDGNEGREGRSMFCDEPARIETFIDKAQRDATQSRTTIIVHGHKFDQRCDPSYRCVAVAPRGEKK